MDRESVKWAPLLLGWLAVLFLVAVNFGAGFLRLGPVGLPVAFAISGTALILIALLCMKLGQAPTLAMIFAGAGICWLMVMLVLGATDYATRQQLPAEGYRSQLQR